MIMAWLPSVAPVSQSPLRTLALVIAAATLVSSSVPVVSMLAEVTAAKVWALPLAAETT